jgi:hypothetical protein
MLIKQICIQITPHRNSGGYSQNFLRQSYDYSQSFAASTKTFEASAMGANQSPPYSENRKTFVFNAKMCIPLMHTLS